MERNEILSQVETIFKAVLKNDSLVLTDDSSAESVPGWDSLTHVTLIAQIEKHFGIKFTLREMLSWKSVGKMVDSIEKKVA